MTSATLSPAAAHILRSHRFHWAELLPWVIAIALYFIFPGYRGLTTQLLVMILFALSVDLVVGYAGIVTLGHAAFYGLGAYIAALLAKMGWGEPVSLLVVAAAGGALLAYISGWIILRTEGLTLLMLTMAVTIMLHELATELDSVTGGFDGVNFEPGKMLGWIEFDPIFYETNFFYALIFLFLGFVLIRTIVYSPFGRSLVGIRENVTRMHAIGTPVLQRQVSVYTISGAIAAVAGALFAQVQGNVTPNVFSFELSGEVLIMVILGGVGRLYGAFIGAALFFLLRDITEQILGTTLPWWMLVVGVALIVVVMFARDGIIGIVLNLRAWMKRRRA